MISAPFSGLAAPIGAGGELTIDLGAIAENYRLLARRAAPAQCAAVIKSDAYGLGLGPVAAALYGAGCRAFFIAIAEEGLALRHQFTEMGADADIYVLDGVDADTQQALRAAHLIPVLNSLAEIALWRGTGGGPAALHVDTGMSRLGLCESDCAALAGSAAEHLDGITLRAILSHLACADTPSHPLNQAQLAAFRATLARLPAAPASLANSSGIFLGPDYHFDLVRPGAALFGVAPHPNTPNPMRQVVQLKGKILQSREIDGSQTVGYGATHRASGKVRIATVAVGYGDGYPRALGNRGKGAIDGQEVPLVGRVSMDLTTFDVTGVPPDKTVAGNMVELIGPHYTIDSIARDAGTIGYEILTRLGRRYRRHYLGGSTGPMRERIE